MPHILYRTLGPTLPDGAAAAALYWGIAQRFARLEEIGRAAIDQVNIHPPVVVVIEKCAPGAKRFGQIVLGGHGVVVHPINAAD